MNTVFVLVGVFLLSRMLARLLSIGAWSFRLKKEPPSVRITPELTRQFRDEVIFNAVKGKTLRADFTRNFR